MSTSQSEESVSTRINFWIEEDWYKNELKPMAKEIHLNFSEYIRRALLFYTAYLKNSGSNIPLSINSGLDPSQQIISILERKESDLQTKINDKMQLLQEKLDDFESKDVNQEIMDSIISLLDSGARTGIEIAKIVRVSNVDVISHLKEMRNLGLIEFKNGMWYIRNNSS